MKFVCERCHTKYSIADEKVRGKVLKVRCKSCENVITVRESGASIDEPIAAGPKDLPIVRSGTLEGAGAARGAIAARGTSGARRSPGAAGGGGAAAPSGGAVATAASARRPMPAAAFSDPLAPAEAPPPPRRRAPTPPPGTALVVVADDGLDWYLAVDGAQTGPFNRPTLIEKILAVPPDGDIHVWNAGLGAWKPPQDVPDVESDVVRMRRAAHVIPPVPSPRRPGEAAHVPTGRGAGAEAGPHHGGGANGVSALGGGVAPGAHGGAKVHLHDKSNGVGPSAPGGAAHAAPSGFGLEDLFNEASASTSSPSQAQVVAATVLGALPSATMSSSAGVAPASTSATGASSARPGRQTKLIMGAVALAAIVCTIVAVALLRKPSAVTVANTPRPAGSNEPQAKPPATVPAPPVPTPPPAPETNPVAAKIEGKPGVRAETSGKSGRGRGRRRGGGGTSPTAPPPIGGMTTEQLQAANRFGEATPRDIRAAASASPSARSTPAQADISRVISNNRQGIQTCYQRALLRDSTLTQGKVTVRVSIGISGRVKSVNLDAPPPFRSMEPCVRDVMSRWAFPPSSEEYGTEFPVVLQGNQ